MTERLSANVIEGAGGVVVRHDSEEARIAVIYRERYAGEWGLPKGKRQPGESWQGTALREVEEEIGLKPVITGIVGATAYLAGGVPKLVLYWRMRVDGEMPPFKPNDEVKVLAWLTREEAIKRLTHREEADIVRRAFPIAWHITSFHDRVARLLVRIFRRRAVNRLSSDIAAYIEELEGRARTARSIPLLQAALKDAEDGEIERGWKYLQTARRLKLAAGGPAVLAAAAISLRKEAATKLTSWRKEAVEKLLPEGTSTPAPERVYEAARLCDEHFNNEAYKDGLRRSSAKWLALFLLMAVLLLFWISCNGYLSAILTPDDKGSSLFRVLVSVAVLGLLGAVVSAITNLAKPGAPTRIPELVSTFRVTLLRLLMGPASAIILYFVMQTDLSPSILSPSTLKAKTDGSGYIILIIAFVAGFSERLVLRVVQSFDDKSSK